MDTGPVMRTDAAAELDEVTVRVAGGEANLGRLVSETYGDAFHSPEDLIAELDDVVPADATSE